MKRFKEVLRRLWFLVKKHWLWILIITSLIILLLLLQPIMRRDWLKYPPSLKARVALAYLAADQVQGVNCRERCQAQRRQYQEFLLLAGEELQAEIRAVIINENTNPEIRAALANYWHLQNWGSPQDLDINSLSVAQKLILTKTWPELMTATEWDELVGYFQGSASDTERLNMLQSFLGEDRPVILGLILTILTAEYSWPLKEQAYFLWSNLPDKQLALSLMPLEDWLFLIYHPDAPSSLKEAVILGASDYYPSDPEAVQIFFSKVINQEEVDETTKQLAEKTLINLRLNIEP